MALPQTVDPSTLNLSGKPALSTATAPTITSPGSAGMLNPTIAQEKTSVPPAAGALLGYVLGNYMDRTSGTAGTSTGTGVGGILNSIFGGSKAPTSGSINTGGGTPSPTNAGNVVQPGVPAGNTPGIGGTSVDSQLIAWDAPVPAGKVVSGYTFDNQGNPVKVITTDTTISPYTPNGTGGGSSTQTTGTQTNGTPSDTNTDITPSDTLPGYYQNSQGDIYDNNGDLLMIRMSDGNYYDPNMDSYFTSDFMPISSSDIPSTDTSYIDNIYNPPTDITGGGGYSDNSSFDNSAIDTGTYVKDGGHIGSGLPTPLFKSGGKVKGYADGNLVTDSTGQQVYPNYSTTSDNTSATPTALNVGTGGYDPTAATNTTNTNPPATYGSPSTMLDAITGLFGTNSAKGALLGALMTQLMGSSTQPVNKGVDMSALSSMKPRTTSFGMGPANYVPYSEYGTPTTPNDYSTLFSNLGVSPFGRGAVSPAFNTPAAPTPSTPSGALGVIGNQNQGNMGTPVSNAPQYYQDDNGNIYDANGDLAYDATTGQVVSQNLIMPNIDTSSNLSPAQQILLRNDVPINQTSSVSSNADPYYSYGTPVTPSSVLGSKTGGLASQNLAIGGTPLNYNVSEPSGLGSKVPTIDGRHDYRQGSYVEGPGDGQSDDIPAMLADGEYVIDAETVSQLGNGSNKAGAKVLDTFRKNIRAHKRSAPLDKIPPKSKSALAYLKGAK